MRSNSGVISGFDCKCRDMEAQRMVVEMGIHAPAAIIVKGIEIKFKLATGIKNQQLSINLKDFYAGCAFVTRFLILRLCLQAYGLLQFCRICLGA